MRTSFQSHALQFRQFTVLATTGDTEQLLRDARSNPVTGYVLSRRKGAMVPNHAAQAVSAYLEELGWTRA